jgi:tetratricopeptide (TPR) repeat protein
MSGDGPQQSDHSKHPESEAARILSRATRVASQVSPARPPYMPAIGSRLKRLLQVVFAVLAVLVANSLYLASVTFLEWNTGHTYQNQFSLFMFLGHVGLGLVFVVPFVVFGTVHLWTARKRKNKRAIRVGYALFAISLAVLVSGLLLVRISGLLELKQPVLRSSIYWLHVLSPLVALWLYWLHRLVGQKIKWRLGLAYGGITALIVGAMLSMHAQDPREWYKIGSSDGLKYFEPSLARTANGGFIPAQVLDNDEYCLKCHADAYASWEHSAHHFSSFNNPAYLASVRETREVAYQRDGDVSASRWCAGCHDPVPFFSGAFDDPKFDDVGHPTAQAGITCTVCHAITHVNSTRGNADFTIEEPLHYPFAFSQTPWLQWLNNQLIKAKPEFHKRTFLKEFHKTSEFCSTCHKVHLPFALNQYKEFLRGQNHYDSWLLSGVSGHGARGFYFPEKAQTACADCHMKLQASADFGAQVFESTGGVPSIHDHLFAAGNVAVPALRGFEQQVADKHRQFLQGILRVDIFGIKEGGAVDGQLHAPLRPTVPTLVPGQTYLLETVVRTLTVGHEFTQGTVDSNEVWLDVTLSSGGRVIGRSGGRDLRGEVDRWAHYFNVFMLDREGNRINRRNPQDIFTPLYDHQIPPGASRVVHFSFVVPEDLTDSIEVTIKLQYRKFDYEFMRIVQQRARPGDIPMNIASNRNAQGPADAPVEFVNDLPVLTLATDQVSFPVAGISDNSPQVASEIPLWQRWNDYGIGLFLEGKSELKQAEQAFQEVEQLERYDGPLNLARVYLREGRISEATEAVQRAALHKAPAAPEWSLAWFSGLVNREEGRLSEAEQNFRSLVDIQTEERRRRGFDFSRDYEVLNTLGRTIFDQAEQLRAAEDAPRRVWLLQEAARQFNRTLAIDPENVNAHYNLGLLYGQLGDQREQLHRDSHLRYKPDDNAQGLAVRKAREKYPAANYAAEPLVIYPLQRPGVPELPASAARQPTP